MLLVELLPNVCSFNVQTVDAGQNECFPDYVQSSVRNKRNAQYFIKVTVLTVLTVITVLTVQWFLCLL